MADSNTSKFAGQREDSFATLAVPALKQLRITSEKFTHEKDTVASNEVRPDRQTPDLAKVGGSAKGSVDFELSYTDWLEYFEAALFTTIINLSLTAQSCDLTASTQRIAAVSGTPFSAVIPGMFVRVIGAATSLNNGIKRVIAIGGSGAYVTLVSGSLTADESAVSLTIKGKGMKNGVTRNTYAFERALKNGSDAYVYQRYVGMAIDELSLKFATKAIVTGQLTFIGKNGEPSASALSAYSAASVDPVMNASSNVGTLIRDGAEMSEKMKTFGLSIKNGIRGKDAISYDNIFDVGVGACKITGDFSAYFFDNDLFSDFLANADVELGFTVTDAAGNSICFYWPRVKLATGNPDGIGGKDQDVMQSCTFEALIGTGVYDGTMYVSFVPAS